VDHVALYLGDGEIIHATNKQGKVVREKISDLNGVVGARRIPRFDEERIVVEIPDEKKELRDREALLNLLNESYLITAA
jgi:hypothetical protein